MCFYGFKSGPVKCVQTRFKNSLFTCASELRVKVPSGYKNKILVLARLLLMDS